MLRRTKIVCTLGPASRSSETIGALVEDGMDVARLNFSHGTQEEHRVLHDRVREASQACGRPVAVLADLQGPKIRLGKFENGAAVVEPGSLFVVTGEPTEGTSERASVTYPPLADDVGPGDVVLIDDGSVRLRALASDGRRVSCRVEEGGSLSDAKGVNLPGTDLHAATLTEKDVDDLRFALDMGADMVALSFVRRPEDIVAAHQVMEEVGRRVPVIAKIEKPEAVGCLEAIADTFDGLMVARGDLGVEIPLEMVPSTQRRAVRLARQQAKPVIVATQMLESMVHRLRPTRAEVSDVANAVLDGADALMLAGETGIGEHPVEVLSTMARIVGTAEEDGRSELPPLDRSPSGRQEAVAVAAVQTAASVGARGLVALTATGRTARCLSRHRPPVPVVAVTSDPAVQRRLALTWGVEAHVVPAAAHLDAELAQVDDLLRGVGYRNGDKVILVAGQTGEAGSTHTMRVHEVAS